MSSNKDIFNSAVLPVMKKVQHDLEEAKRQEMIKHQSSWHANMLGGIGPDGGMTAIASHNNLIYTIGEWNSKTADDYLKTVNKILLSKGIGPQTVGPLDHEVTDVALQVFGKIAAATIGETDNFVGGSDAKRPSRSAVRSVAADAGVDVRRKSELGLDCGDFLARACASVDESLLTEPA